MAEPGGRGDLPLDPELEVEGPTARDRGPGAPFHPLTLLAVAAGGALGAPARVGIDRLITAGADHGFPWATFVINVSGSFLLGLVVALVVERLPPTRLVRPFLAAGFCGAFTTFSALAVDVDRRVQTGHAAVGLLYAGTSLVAGLAAVVAGTVLAERLPWPRRGVRP